MNGPNFSVVLLRFEDKIGKLVRWLTGDYYDTIGIVFPKEQKLIDGLVESRPSVLLVETIPIDLQRKINVTNYSDLINSGLVSASVIYPLLIDSKGKSNNGAYNNSNELGNSENGNTRDDIIGQNNKSLSQVSNRSRDRSIGVTQSLNGSSVQGSEVTSRFYLQLVSIILRHQSSLKLYGYSLVNQFISSIGKGITSHITFSPNISNANDNSQSHVVQRINSIKSHPLLGQPKYYKYEVDEANIDSCDSINVDIQHTLNEHITKLILSGELGSPSSNLCKADSILSLRSTVEDICHELLEPKPKIDFSRLINAYSSYDTEANIVPPMFISRGIIGIGFPSVSIANDMDLLIPTSGSDLTSFQTSELLDLLKYLNSIRDIDHRFHCLAVDITSELAAREITEKVIHH